MRVEDERTITLEEAPKVADREAYNLSNLKRVDEALAHYDRWIAASRGNPNKRLTLLRAKAERVRHHDRPVQSIAAWRAYREASKPASENWLWATADLAHELRNAEHHYAAPKLVSEYLAVEIIRQVG